MLGIIEDVPAPVDSKESTQACYVCSHPTASPHFGSISCLACAAFFRRTVALELQFKCSKNAKCRVFHELRMSCRGCRFSKCLKVGMKPKHVLKRRPNTSEMKDMQSFEEPTTSIYDHCSLDSQIPELESVEPSVMDPHFFAQPSDQSSSAPSYTRLENRMKASTSSHEAPHSSEITISPLGIDGVVLLEHYVTELHRAMDRRCIMFTSDPFRAMTGTYNTVPYSLNFERTHTMKGQVEGQKFDHLLAFEYCQGCPGYDQMTADERIMFFRTATMSFCVLDIAWITSQATTLEDKLIMYTDGSVSSVEDLSVGWDDEDGLKSEDKSNYFLGILQRFYFALVVPFFEYQLDEVEYAALKAFCVWKMGYCEFTQQLRAIGKEHERGLLIGLNAYYENRENRAERLGNIILLMGSVFEVYHAFMETYQSGDLFRLFQIDNISKELIWK
ncbi:unnamed protein product [Auanema sp. JU1783]|nr:unnamed protein product [Auanema sp. JU1783]